MTLAQLLHEAINQLGPAHQHAIRTLMERERQLQNALGSIAVCGTDCACCRRHVNLAREVLDEHGVKWGFARLSEYPDNRTDL